MTEPGMLDTETKVPQEKDVEHGGRGGVLDSDETSSLGKGDILSREHTDPVLSAKMHLINNVSTCAWHNEQVQIDAMLLLEETQGYQRGSSR